MRVSIRYNLSSQGKLVAPKFHRPTTNYTRHTMEQGLVGGAFKLKHCKGSIGLLLPYAENTLSQIEVKR
jgi:hypothetical protein